MYEDEEIKYIEEGSGFFDVRGVSSISLRLLRGRLTIYTELSNDKWIRTHVTPGDLLVIPAVICHRFTLDEADKVRLMRLFKICFYIPRYSRTSVDCLRMYWTGRAEVGSIQLRCGDGFKRVSQGVRGKCQQVRRGAGVKSN